MRPPAQRAHTTLPVGLSWPCSRRGGRARRAAFPASSVALFPRMDYVRGMHQHALMGALRRTDAPRASPERACWRPARCSTPSGCAPLLPASPPPPPHLALAPTAPPAPGAPCLQAVPVVQPGRGGSQAEPTRGTRSLLRVGTRAAVAAGHFGASPHHPHRRRARHHTRSSPPPPSLEMGCHHPPGIGAKKQLRRAWEREGVRPTKSPRRLMRWRLRDLLPEPTSRHLRDPQHLATSLETATRAPCNLGSRPDVGRVPATKGARRYTLWDQTSLS